jgi:hypothetical protein
VLAVVLGVGGFFAVRYFLDKMVEVGERYSETTPMPLPASSMPAAEYQQLAQRVREFVTAANAKKGAAPLVLDSDDLNALIANHPDWELLRGKAHVGLVGDRVEAEVSVPLDELLGGLPGTSKLQGRYLNGKATLTVGLADGVLDVSVQALRVKGEDLPPNVIAELRGRNLLEGVQANPQIERLEDWIESFAVKDGELTVRAKAGK